MLCKLVRFPMHKSCQGERRNSQLVLEAPCLIGGAIFKASESAENVCLSFFKSSQAVNKQLKKTNIIFTEVVICQFQGLFQLLSFI